MKRQSVLVMLLLTLTGILIGSTVSGLVPEQSVSEYVPPPPMRVAKSDPYATPVWQSAPVAEQSLVPPEPSNNLYSEPSAALSPSIYEMSDLLYTTPPQAEGPIAPSPASYGVLGGYLAPPMPVPEMSPVSYGSYAQSVPYSAHGLVASIVAMPGRFQMALERSTEDNKIIVVMCDTATGQCWHGNVGSKEWSCMGTPMQLPESSQGELPPLIGGDSVTLPPETTIRPDQVDKPKSVSAWDAFSRF